MKRSLCVLSVLLLAVWLLACAALAVPAPKPSLKEWGDPVNPDHDCKIRLDDGVLSIEMPGTEHDYDPVRKRFNAPRILREIEGEFDLQVRIRIDCPPSAQSSVESEPAYVSAGFLMLFPDSPLYLPPRYETACKRLDYGIIQQRVGIDDFRIGIDFPGELRGLAHLQIDSKSREGVGEDGCFLVKDWVYNLGARENGGPLIGRNRFQQIRLCLFDRGWQDWPMPKKADCVYLRMERGYVLGRKGMVISISPNGEKWTQLTGYTWGQQPKLKVGLAAYSTSAEPSKVCFDQIKFTQGKKKSK